MLHNDTIQIIPLGAGNEVGRSCILLKHKDRTLMFDCGVHPAYTGTASLPFLDLVDLSTLDAVFITHFHLDHAGALPFLTEKTAFRGKVYMTHPTKAILRWLLNDYIRIINASSDTDFYTETDLKRCYERIIAIDYHQQVNVRGCKVTPLNAGHVLGAAMFLIEVGRARLLYTGDYSREEDRHLRAAESPGGKLDILIAESTYGVQCHLPRAEREHRFTSTVHEIVRRGGRCLLPVFALGRAQELLLILEEYWESHPELQQVPIYYASALAKRCMGVYQTYVNTMNDRIKKMSLIRNPFVFKHIQNLKGMEHYEDKGACVMMASPGMLQSGLSRELFELWCENSSNGVVLAGYCVNGTLAKEILSEPREIEALNGRKLKLNMSVEYVSFSAHVDFLQNSAFIDECMPDHLFLVHGEYSEMTRLKNALNHRCEQQGREMCIYTPKNGEEISIPMAKEQSARVRGELKEGEIIEGILFSSKDELEIFRRSDVKLNESKIRELSIMHKQKIPFNSKFSLVKQTLMEFFEDLTVKNESLFIGGVRVYLHESDLIIEWKGSYVNDVVAYTINRMVKGIGKTVSSVRLSRLSWKDAVVQVLRNYFESVIEENGFIIVEDGNEKVEISINSESINKGDSGLESRVRSIIEKVDLVYS
ncbi:Cleavage and polyadenylation specificity factor subunit 3 [Astathelohania contejeani]|uniref:Cleavage and polyadenylation specificity factor subunit 3 n=1 Tax=Astathelohania contejeani TaxID=164912 RepID=A0ABQ7I084_9MICR|nr:Cleavage and polyadenylation specificity factor subunit 3 [Thelohania contejeani]